jgi:hypothetical protein
MARPLQTMFLVEDVIKAAGILRPETEDRVRRILKVMDDIEAKQVEAVNDSHLTVEALDTIHLRRDETDALQHEYRRWRRKLANNMGVPIYPYADEPGSGAAGNIPVERS